MLGKSRRAQSRNELDVYKLSADTEEQGADQIIRETDNKALPALPNGKEEVPRSPNWYQAQFGRVKSGQFGKKKSKPGDDGSEKSLREKNDKSERSERGSLNEESGTAMQIMVSRTFLVTDSERTSYHDGSRR